MIKILCVGKSTFHFMLFSGADAILMHSKRSDPKDIEAFMKAWNNQVRKMHKKKDGSANHK